MEVIEQIFACPHCGENTAVELDLSVDSQEFIEDCEVCCKPIDISYAVSDGALSEFECQRAQ